MFVAAVQAKVGTLLMVGWGSLQMAGSRNHLSLILKIRVTGHEIIMYFLSIMNSFAGGNWFL